MIRRMEYFLSILIRMADSEVKIWLDEEEQNLVHHSVYPFAGPHGATTMSYESNLDSFDYE